MKDVQAIAAVLAAINILLPGAMGLVTVILDWFAAEHPEMTNAERIAALRRHGLDNIGLIDDWFATHPD